LWGARAESLQTWEQGPEAELPALSFARDIPKFSSPRCQLPASTLHRKTCLCQNLWNTVLFREFDSGDFESEEEKKYAQDFGNNLCGGRNDGMCFGR
jgi:hypothetical protein